MTKQEHNPFELADIWEEHMRKAREFGLEAEVTQFALQSMVQSDNDLRSFLSSALDEWVK